ncbi:MAG TPA: hypothetical protein VEZ44_04445 [bacterium]|nr:hypothetical protein [bacterium]
MKQWILFALTVALAVLPELAQLEPGWTWTARAFAVVTVLLGIFKTDSKKTLDEHAELTAKVVRLSGDLAGVPSTRPTGPAGGGPGGAAAATLIAFGVATATLVSADACTPAQQVATEHGVVDLLICVLNHSTEPVNQIVTDCGASSAESVIAILDAHHAAEAREKAAAK